MGWRIVHIKNGDYLRLRLDNIEITKLSQKVFIPLSDIIMIVMEGNKTSISTKLLSALSKNNIGLVICDDKFLPSGLFLPYGQYHHVSKRVIAQSEWSKSQKDLLWQAIIKQKMVNQLSFARYLGVDQDRIDMMDHLISKLTIGDKTNREGHVAKVYFDSLFGNSFTRDDDILINYAMNFGYSIIRSEIARIIVGNGLVTMLGVFHRNEFNSFNLADDLMEPFRPLMDYWINTLLDEKDTYLSYKIRLKIIDFIDQTIILNGKTVTMDDAMQKFVQSFIVAIDSEDPDLLVKIELNNFIGD
ncbi:CRISPR-associated protein Cas1 [Ligilactobacillus salitolerans]|uniref:CRISPR-associated endonuclease Cas1 n=1 Tax=Ligilactobacillus salitolerans TaxID=1808352 RepID=A0A401IRW7_9LACO|nr:type II CRISPR-associated endonuclease Cas1 [Ligilactobacillus salitolerans]GBG94280.1 CRISPR-associated protein Cas1 [Ligilactobacillus salitolerans]